MPSPEAGEESVLLAKGPCQSCGSSDACASYSDGHTFCFSCGHFTPGEAGATSHSTKGRTRMAEGLIQGGEFRALSARKITEETCRKFNYRIATLSDGRTVHVAPYYDADGELVAQKIRPSKKDDMFVCGKMKAARLFGQQLWSPGGRKVVVTEGEIDAMSVSQVQGNKWPVVSIPSGAQGAKAALSKQIEWLSSFEEVILMFDMDEPGRTAAADCAPLFKPGQCKIATLPRKDASDCLQHGETAAIISAIFNAQAYRPDGLIRIRDVAAQAKAPPVPGIPWAWPTVTRWTFGRRCGELYGFGAGTGVGKTDLFTQQIEYDVNTLKVPVGLFYLEQNPVETVQRLAGKMKGKAFHVDDGTWTLEERAQAIDELEGNDLVHLYQSFGHTDWNTIASLIRFLAAQGVKHFYLDHLTALADPSNERESLEKIMESMAAMTNELGLIMHYVSHLATPEGKSHEEGGKVSSKHFKGARAIAFWSSFMFGLERDKQAEDPEQRTVATLRCIKDRMTGRADGETLLLKYNRETSRLEEYTPPAKASTYNFSEEDADAEPAPF